MKSDRIRPILFFLFVLSGFCSLLYQVVWLRLAYASFGIITPIMSILISSFMIGLSLGSWAGGKWVGNMRSITGLSAIQLYALTEFLIGIGSFLVPMCFSSSEELLLSLGEMESFRYLVISALLMSVSILPWCVLMGLTFPFMMSFIRDIDATSSEGFSFLYVGNVIGAMGGTLLTAYVLVELCGFRTTTTSAAFVNLLIALISVLLGARHASEEKAQPHPVSADRPVVIPAPASEEPAVMLTALFASGLASMSMEVVWVRAYMPIVGTQIYSFAFILGVYLYATAVGSYFYRRHLQRNTVWKTDVLMTSLFAVSFLPLVLGDPRIVFYLKGFLGESMSMLMVFCGIFPLCALTGYLTPQLIDTYSRGRPEQAGRAYAVNIVGCVIGPILASYVLLPYLGIKWSLVLLSVPFMLLHLFYHLRSGLHTRWHGVLSAVAVTLLLIAVFESDSYEEFMVGAEQSSIVRRDYAATVLSFGRGFQKQMLINGQAITRLTPITKYMAHIPLSFFEGKPRSALVICFGMGTTYRSLLSWGIDVTAVELVPSVRDAFGYYFDDANAVLQNPRGRIIIDDGRRFLKRTDRKFDVITIDHAPPVEAAGVSLLLSGEFYASIKKHLNEGGIVQQWFAFGEDRILYAMTRTIVNSFKHVKVYRSIEGYGYHFIASDSDLKPPTIDEIAVRMPACAQKDLLEWSANKDLSVPLSTILKQEVPLWGMLNNDTTVVISDDKPYNEYYMLRRLRAYFTNTYRTMR